MLLQCAVDWPIVGAVAIRDLNRGAGARSESAENGTAVAENTATKMRTPRKGDPPPETSAVPSP
jgi:hypothetical protein